MWLLRPMQHDMTRRPTLPVTPAFHASQALLKAAEGVVAFLHSYNIGARITRHNDEGQTYIQTRNQEAFPECLCPFSGIQIAKGYALDWDTASVIVITKE